VSRDHRKLRVFALADELVVQMYHATNEFPVTERVGLQLQLRRAAVSVVTNIVEGSARRSKGEYLSFLNIAAGSAAEAQYLTGLATRLGVLAIHPGQKLAADYATLCAALQALIRSLADR
jgi:four helix bundle protein